MTDSQLSQIPGDIINNAVQEVFAKQLNTNNFQVHVEAGSKHGDNFIGIVYRVTGEISNKCDTVQNGNGDRNENEKNVLKIIVKVAPQTAARRKQFFARPSFLREIFMYNEVLPIFRKFQESKGIIPEENGFHEYPVCYKTIDIDVNEALILQDLKQLQFEMIDHRNKPISIDHASLVFNVLGKFHALSFAFKDQNGEKFKELTNDFDEILLHEKGKAMKMYINSLKSKAFDCLIEGNDTNLINKLNQLFAESPFDVALSCVNGKTAEPYAIICHGDCWSNNTLFKHDKNGKPIDVRLLDWQISRYASAANDLIYFLFCCTTKEFRDLYYDKLLNIYHSSLANMLNRLGTNVEKVYPFDAMKDQLRKFGKFGIVMALMLLPILTSEAGSSPDLDHVAEKGRNGESTEHMFSPEETIGHFNKRMRDVIIDMDRLGYI